MNLTVSTNDRRDETTSLVKIHAPDHNPLESWGDTRPVAGVIGLRQPTVAPLFDTRSACASFLRWAGDTTSEDDYLRARWESQVLPRAKGAPASFVPFWDRALQDGFAEMDPPPPEAPPASPKAPCPPAPRRPRLAIGPAPPPARP